MKKILLSLMVMSFVVFAMAANVSATWWEPYCPGCQTEFSDTKTNGNWFDYTGESKDLDFQSATRMPLPPAGLILSPGDIINKAALKIKFTDNNDPWYAPFEYAKLVLDGSTY